MVSLLALVDWTERRTAEVDGFDALQPFGGDGGNCRPPRLKAALRRMLAQIVPIKSVAGGDKRALRRPVVLSNIGGAELANSVP